MVIFGGNISDRDAWALSFEDPPSWTRLPCAGGLSPPGEFSCSAAIYDPIRDRMVITGAGADPQASIQTWALSFAGTPCWTHLEPPGPAPSARPRHGALYDPIRDRMVIFGGHGGWILPTDVWALELGGDPRWTLLEPDGTFPCGRYGTPIVYEPDRDAMLLFGGMAFEVDPLDDCWELTWGEGSSWKKGGAPGQPARTMASLRSAAPRSSACAGIRLSVSPSPFRGSTTIRFQPPASTGERVRVGIHDVAGRLVRTLSVRPGRGEASWDGRDDLGRILPGGVYLIRVDTKGGGAATEKVVLGAAGR